MSFSESPTFKHMPVSCQPLFSIPTAFFCVTSVTVGLRCPKAHLHNPFVSLIETNAESDRWVNGPTAVSARRFRRRHQHAIMAWCTITVHLSFKQFWTINGCPGQKNDTSCSSEPPPRLSSCSCCLSLNAASEAGQKSDLQFFRIFCFISFGSAKKKKK